MGELWQRAFREPLEVLAGNVLGMLPNVLAMTIIISGGLVTAWGIGYLVERVLRAIGLDHLANRVGINAALLRSGVKQDTPALAGRVVFWLLLVLAVMAGLSALNLQTVNQFIQSFLGYIPYWLTSVVILALGYLLSNFISQAVLIAAVNAKLPPARLAAAYSRWGVRLLAVAMALEQLGIAQHIVIVGFSLAFGGAILAMALAFGLGARDLAKEFLERQLGKSRGRNDDDLRHF